MVRVTMEHTSEDWYLLFLRLFPFLIHPPVLLSTDTLTYMQIENNVLDLMSKIIDLYLFQKLFFFHLISKHASWNINAPSWKT